METTYLADGTALVFDPAEPNIRYVAWQDCDASDPRDDYGTEIEQYVYHTSYRGIPDAPDYHRAETHVMGAFLRHFEENGDDQAALEFARRYARVFGILEKISTDTIQGHSQSDWWDVVTVTAYSPDSFIPEPDLIAETFGQWLRGDVYAVVREYATICDQGETHWDREDPETGLESFVTGGYYADDIEDAVAEYAAQN